MDTPESIRRLILIKFREKKTQQQISNETNVPQSTISRILKRYKENGEISAQRKSRCGRKRKLSDRLNRSIKNASIRNPRATARDIQSEVGMGALDVSIDSIKRSLRRSGLTTYRPLKSPALSRKQQRTRYLWCKVHENWTVVDWKKVKRWC